MADKQPAILAQEPVHHNRDLDVWSHLQRAFFYWVGAFASLLAGAYYSHGAMTWETAGVLLTFATFLAPCYVIFGFSDRDPKLRFEVNAATSIWIRYFRGLENSAWQLAVILCWGLLPFLLWALAGRRPEIATVYNTIPGKSLIYCLILLALHAYYAIWLLRRHHDPDMTRVRYEVLIPVLIIGLTFFTGATVFDDRFSYTLALPAVGAFIYFGALHFWERRRVERKGEKISSTAYAWLTAALLVALPILTRLVATIFVDAPMAEQWSTLVLVALCLGLYLSVFELWRLIGKTNERRRVMPALFPDTSTPENYYQGILVSHVVVIGGLPLMFMFGNLGPSFMVLATVHATVGFVVWYRRGAPDVTYTSGWRLARVVFGFLFFGIFAWGVYRRPDSAVPPVDFYPRNLSGVSTDLFVALLLAFFATPFVQYFTEHRDGGQRPRALISVVKHFFQLPHKEAVFRQAAVMFGVLFISVNFLYEIAREYGWGLMGKASVVFWIYAAGTVAFSILAFFFEGSARRPEPPHAKIGPHGVIAVALGVLQTLRVVTGFIVVLGVASIGIAWRQPLSLVLSTGLAVGLAAMASFALNDYYDWKKDVMNAPHRAVPSGRLTPREVLLVGLSSLIVAVLIGLRAADGLGLALFLVGASGGALYNEFVRRLPEWKAPMTATLCSLIVAFDIVTFALPAHFLWVCCACLAFVSGRELLMDVRDLYGDAKSHVRTAAVLWGERYTTRAGFAMLWLSIVPMALFVAASEAQWRDVLLMCCYSAVIGVAALIWYSGTNRRRWIAIETLKVAMLVAIVAMVV